jgi:hypothetical protein
MEAIDIILVNSALSLLALFKWPLGYVISDAKHPQRVLLLSGTLGTLKHKRQQLRHLSKSNVMVKASTSGYTIGP